MLSSFNRVIFNNAALEDHRKRGKEGGWVKKAKNTQITDVKMLYFHITKIH